MIFDYMVNRLFEDEILKTMFYPGTGPNDCSKAWKRHACRRTFCSFMAFMNKLRDVRDRLEEVNLDSFPDTLLTEKMLRLSIAQYFAREFYHPEGSHPYPDSYAGDRFNHHLQPIVFHTRKASPRCHKSRFVREVRIDANELKMIILGKSDESQSNYAANIHRIPMYVLVQPIGYDDVLKSCLHNSNRFNFGKCCLSGTNQVGFISPYAVIFIRAFIVNLIEMSMEGREFSKTTGNVGISFQRIGSFSIFGAYALRHVFNYDNKKTFVQQMKNYGKLFHVNFWNDPSVAREVRGDNYFEKWLEYLSSRSESATYMKCLRVAIDDLDLIRVGNLIFFRKTGEIEHLHHHHCTHGYKWKKTTMNNVKNLTTIYNIAILSTHGMHAWTRYVQKELLQRSF
jgi:hypothetical protein